MENTFFSALAVGLCDYTRGWTSTIIHQKLILHFCSIVFTNSLGCKSIAEILNHRQSLILNPECVQHPAIKLWIKRVHAVEVHLHDSPEMWFKAYPKLFKAYILQFIHYHRSYNKKPLRLFCRQVFCQLACEVFACSITLANRAERAVEGVQHFYPIEAQDYYLPTSFPTIILKYLGSGKFRYCETQDSEPLIDLQLCFVSESSQVNN